jgi:hypothetical protein
VLHDDRREPLGFFMTPFPDSLCHRCAHLRVVESAKGSTFLMCREPTLPKYPPQPVRSCPAFRSERE